MSIFWRKQEGSKQSEPIELHKRASADAWAAARRSRDGGANAARPGGPEEEMTPLLTNIKDDQQPVPPAVKPADGGAPHSPATATAVQRPNMDIRPYVDIGTYMQANLSIRAVIQHIGKGNDIDVQNHLGATFLHLAVTAGNVELAYSLLAHGANTKIVDNLGRTAYDLAAERKLVDLAPLLAPGARVSASNAQRDEAPPRIIETVEDLRRLSALGPVILFIDIFDKHQQPAIVEGLAKEVLPAVRLMLRGVSRLPVFCLAIAKFGRFGRRTDLGVFLKSRTGVSSGVFYCVKDSIYECDELNWLSGVNDREASIRATRAAIDFMREPLSESGGVALAGERPQAALAPEAPSTSFRFYRVLFALVAVALSIVLGGGVGLLSGFLVEEGWPFLQSLADSVLEDRMQAEAKRPGGLNVLPGLIGSLLIRLGAVLFVAIAAIGGFGLSGFLPGRCIEGLRRRFMSDRRLRFVLADTAWFAALSGVLGFVIGSIVLFSMGR